MSIDINPGPAFDKRLAELAWEHADDLTKSTLAANVALAIIGNKDVLAKLQQQVSSKLLEKITAVVMASEPLTKSVDDIVAKAREQLATKGYQKNLLDKHAQVTSESVKTVISDKMQEILEPQAVKETALRTCTAGVVEAIKSVLKHEKGLIRDELYRRINQSLDIIRQVDESCYKTVLDHIRKKSKGGNWP